MPSLCRARPTSPVHRPHRLRSAGLSCLLGVLLAACGGAPPDTAPEPTAPDGGDRPYLVMVSFDGMRHDFIDRTDTPNFDRVARSGGRAEALIPSFPTKTFPNHYTLATGLYPGNHGLVDNAFYDPDLDAGYAIGDRDAVRDGRWYGGEPIWVTAERQGVRTASFFWVGTEAPVTGIRPDRFKYYDGGFPYAARVDTVLHWLSLPKAERPHLVLLYFSQPDHVAHDQGPGGAGVDPVVRELDGLLGRLLDGLAELPISRQVHVLLVSDHGMAEVPEGRVERLDLAADLTGVRIVNNGTQAHLYVKDPRQRDAIHSALEAELEHATVYRRDETPERWHYRGNGRVGDLLVSAEPGWLLGTGERGWRGGGMHGWDPAVPAMRGIFFAMGPSIRPGARIDAFENVHVYPLAAHLLGLKPAAGIDGRLETLAPLLREPVRSP